MKKTILYISLLSCLFFFACKKISVTVVPYDAYGISPTQGLLKVVYASAYTANPTVRLRLNGNIVSNGITGRTPFPGGGYNTAGSNYPLYLSIPQGDNTLAVTIVKSGTSVDSIVLFQTTFNIPDNSAYTLHITDTLSPSANKTTTLLVKNPTNPVNPGFCRYRFVNLIPNGAVDLYINGIKIVSNIAYKQASDTFRVAIGANTPGVTDPLSIPAPTWAIRTAGAAATSTALATYQSTNTMIDTKVYTIFSMGYVGGTANRLPFVSFTLDKNDVP